MKKIFLIWLLLFTAALFGNTPYQKGYSAYQAKEYGTAMKYFYISARRHNANAYAKLGIMYEEGLGTSVNTLAAFYWYQKAAQRNHAEAQYRLGHLYEAGAGIQNNQKKAAMWYRRAAKNGSRDARIRRAGKQTKTPASESSDSHTSRSFFDRLAFWKKRDNAEQNEQALSAEKPEKENNPKSHAGKSLKGDDNQSSKEESSTSFFDHLKFWNSSDKNDTAGAAGE